MTRSILPTRGVFVPTNLLFDPTLSPSAFHTWAQLRALAWGLKETPPFSVQQLIEIMGKKTSTIYGHMAVLRDRDALRWRSAGDGTIIVSFPETAENSERLLRSDSKNPEMPVLKDASSLIQLSSTKEDLKSVTSQNSGTTSTTPDDDAYLKTMTPAQLYKTLTKITPHPIQVVKMSKIVTNLTLWQDTIEHWITHSWNKRNIPGLLNLYSLGGPDKCLFCQHADHLTNKRQRTINQTIANLEEVYKELHDGHTG